MHIFQRMLFDQADDGTSAPAAGAPAASAPELNLTPEAKAAASSNPYAGKWYDGVESDLFDDPSMKVFRDKDGSLDGKKLIKSYVHAKRAMGAKISVPEADASDDVWNDFHRKSGVPENIADYKVDGITAEEMGDDFFKEYVKNSHKQGLTPRQASGLAKWFKENSVENDQRQRDEYEGFVKQSEQQLRQNWGLGFESKMDRAQRALATLADKEDADALANSGFNSNPALIRIFERIGQEMGEDRLDSTTNTMEVQARQSAESLIDKVSENPDHPYWNSEHPDHGRAVEKYTKAFNKLNG